MSMGSAATAAVDAQHFKDWQYEEGLAEQEEEPDPAPAPEVVELIEELARVMALLEETMRRRAMRRRAER